MKLDKNKIFPISLLIASLYVAVYAIDSFVTNCIGRGGKKVILEYQLNNYFLYFTLFTTLILLTFFVFYKKDKKKEFDFFRVALTLVSSLFFLALMSSLSSFLWVFKNYKVAYFSVGVAFYALLFFLTSFFLLSRKVDKKNKKKGLIGFVVN